MLDCIFIVIYQIYFILLQIRFLSVVFIYAAFVHYLQTAAVNY